MMLNDIEDWLRLIHEFADYENLSHEVEAKVTSLAGLIRSNHGHPPPLYALIARIATLAVGFASGYPTVSTFAGKCGFFLEDLYVSPAWRHRGIGTQLFEAMKAYALDAGYARMEWHALAWNTPAIDFYVKTGAQLHPDWRLFRQTLNF